jgi:glycolate oxidase
MPYKKMSESDIQYLKIICGEERVFETDMIHEDYTHDEMPEYGVCVPDVVVRVLSAGEVSKIMRYAWENNIPVTPRGSGTGLCGGAVAIYGGILLSLEAMNKIVEIDEENMTVTAEAGVLLMDLNKAVTEKGFLYPPDPGEKSATIGGNVMTNAGGMRAVKYGVTRDYVKEMQVVLPEGKIVLFGGKVSKNSSGYSLKDLMIGSEGTLGIMTRVVLKLIPLPAKTISLLIPFKSFDECLGTVPKILKRSKVTPAAIEFMQREVIEEAEIYLGSKFPDRSSEAYLLLSYDGCSAAEIEKTYEDAAATCLEEGALDVYISDTEERQNMIWSARGAFLEAIKSSTSQMDECDVVVPGNRIAEYMSYVNKLQNDHDIRIRSFGHAGDGNLHVYVCRDSLDADAWKSRLNKVMEGLYKKAVELNGQVSGEHGIGHAKKYFLKNSVGDESMELMRGIKAVFDRKNILNPGKIVFFSND